MGRDWRWWGGQGALLLALGLAVWWFAARLAAYPFLSLDFTFLTAPAGIEADFVFLGSPAESSSFAAVLGLAWLDTALLGLAALLGATSAGLALGGLARSSPPLIAGLAAGLIAVLRGLPMKLLLLVLATASVYLPSLRESEVWGGLYLYNRALHVPALEPGAALWLTGGVALASLSLGLWAFQRWSGRRARFVIGGLLLLAPLIAFLATGRPLELQPPLLKGFSLVGGWQIPLPTLVAWLALSLYGAGAIATARRREAGRWWSVAAPHWPRVIMMLPVASLAGLADFLAIASSAGNLAGRALEVLSILLVGYLLLSVPVLLLARCLSRDAKARTAALERPASRWRSLRLGLSVAVAVLGLLLLWRAADWLIVTSVAAGKDTSLCRLAQSLESFDAEVRGIDWTLLMDESAAAGGEGAERLMKRLERVEAAFATFVARFDGLGSQVPADLAGIAKSLDVPGLNASLRAAIDVMDWPTVHALVLDAQPLVSWGAAHGGACWVVVTERWQFWLFGFAPDDARGTQAATCLLLLAAIGLLARGRFSWLAPLPATGAVLLLFLGPDSRIGVAGLSLTLVLWTVSSLVAFGAAPLLVSAARSRLPLLRTLARLIGGIVRALPPLVVLAVSLTLLQMLRIAGGSEAFILAFAVVLGVVGAAYLAHPFGLREGAAPGKARRFAILAGLLRDTTLFVGGFDLLDAVRATVTDAKWKEFTIEPLLAAALVYVLLRLVLRWLMRPPAPGVGDDLYP